MNDAQLNTRQQTILHHLGTVPHASRQELESLFDPPVSKITLIRDINSLIELDYITQKGQARATTYQLHKTHPIIWPTDLASYFRTEVDQRQITHADFDDSIFPRLNNLINPEEKVAIKKANQNFNHYLTSTDDAIVKRELERFVIELSWKSSQIEGNTYSLLETELLIKQAQESPGHTKEEAQMILNHKTTFDRIFTHRHSFSQLTLKDLENIHQSLTQNLNINSGLRSHQVGITGTGYQPPSNRHQLKDYLLQSIDIINQLSDPLEKGLVATLLISMLQPFADGNKRTARLVGNALLLAHDYRPLSYRSVNEVEYKQSLILFYEQRNLFHYRRIFLDQANFAIDNYFKETK